MANADKGGDGERAEVPEADVSGRGEPDASAPETESATADVRESDAPEIDGVLETALYVADLGRSSGFYEDLFGFSVLVADHRMRALSVAGKQVLLLFRRGASRTPAALPGGTIPGHDGEGEQHLALAVPAQGLEGWVSRLEEKGVAIESVVEWSRGGRSLYFRDPDGHLVELVTPGCWEIY